MEHIFIYKNMKTKLHLCFDIRYIDFISLREIKTDSVSYDNENNNEEVDNTKLQDDKFIRRTFKYRGTTTKYITITQLLLKIHFKNTNYHQELFFDKDDEEAYIIYNSLIEAINKNPQSCH